MNRRTGVISIVSIAIIVIVGLLVVRPVTNSAADGPQIVGQMQNFNLTKKLISRPNASWTNAKGNNITLANFDGKVVLFNYWASWCAPCRRELPGIDRLQAKLGGDDFTVVALNIDKGGKRVARKVARELKLNNLKLYLDPQTKTAPIMGLRAMPTTILFDRQGHQIGRIQGAAEWDSREAIALIQYFIDRPNYAAEILGAK